MLRVQARRLPLRHCHHLIVLPATHQATTPMRTLPEMDSSYRMKPCPQPHLLLDQVLNLMVEKSKVLIWAISGQGGEHLAPVQTPPPEGASNCLKVKAI